MYKAYLDGETLYHPNMLEEFPLKTGKVSLELNKTGTFTFSLYSNNKRYGDIKKMKSIVKVYDDEPKINYEVDGYLIKIKGNQTYIASDYSIEGDYSNAAFLMAFNYLGGNINVLGLNEASLQGDKVFVEYFKKLNEEKISLQEK